MISLGAFDLAVVGGGINGAGVARDAAGRGLSTLLLEKDDLAQGTSSRSSKLIHGGLRYLERFEFRLVREALIEREILLRAAPHIVRPMRFVLPHSADQRPAWLIRAGLFLYDHLGGRELLPPARGLDLRRAPEGAPLRKGYARAFEYSDCRVDDARLVVLNALDSSRRGARILTRTAFVTAQRVGDGWNLALRGADGAEASASCRAIVNAAGPWAEEAARACGAASASRLRLVKGSHIVTRKFWPGEHAYLLQNPDKRVVFVTPYENDLALIGTTDVPFSGRVEGAAIDETEIAYLLEAVNLYFAAGPRRDDVLKSFSGVRPLFDDSAGDPSEVTRDYVLELDAPSGGAPLLTIFGGKITTYRRLAEHALERLEPFFPAMTGPWTEGAPLPGGDLGEPDFAAFLNAARELYPWLPERIAHGYAHRYGSRMRELLDGAVSLKDLGRRFGGDLFERETRFLVDEEWARTAEDVLERRTKHGLRMSAAERAEFENWFESSVRPPR